MSQLHRVAQLLLGACLVSFTTILLLRPCPLYNRQMYPESDSCSQDQDPTSLASDRPISLNSTYDDPDSHYQEVRMRLERTAKRVADVATGDAREISRLLVSELRELWRLEGRGGRRRRLAEAAAGLVQRRLRRLQSPADCRAARRLRCPLIMCGFACQAHHGIYCLIVAYATQRTLVFSQKTMNYGALDWEDVFQPVSSTCGDIGGGWNRSSAVYLRARGAGGGPDAPEVTLDAARGFLAATRFQPPAVPADLLAAARRFHGAPHAWWVGQVARFLLRPRPATAALLRAAARRLNFTAPIVGVHVRRGDKLYREAKYHSVEEYMAAVEDFYETLEITEGAGARRIYLATDDVLVFEEISKKYPDYTVIGDREASSMASGKNRYRKEALDGILVDVHLLSKCDHVVCTFSSNVCRLVYELMQTMHTDASMRVTSLDLDYGFTGMRKLRLYRVIMQHFARSPGEMNMRRGDIIALNFYNDTNNYGHNINTSESGYFPIFKTVEHAKPEPFPTFT